MFPLLERDAAQPARAVPDLAEPAARRQDGRRRTSRCCGTTTIPRARRRRRERPRHARSPSIAGRARRRARRRRRRRTRGPRAPTPTSRSGRSRMAPGARGRCRAAARGTQPHALLLPRRARCAVGERELAPHAGVALRADADVALENGADETRAAAAAGPPDRRAGRAVRPVRDEHARTRSSRRSPTTSARSSAAGRGRATTPCTPRERGPLRAPRRRPPRGAALTSPVID